MPPGTLGIGQIGIKLKVRDLETHRRFYAEALGLAEVPHARGAAFQAGETVLLLEESDDAPADAQFQGKGFRYITYQVFHCDMEHAHILAHGGREAMKPPRWARPPASRWCATRTATGSRFPSAPRSPARWRCVDAMAGFGSLCYDTGHGA
ncbi:MAG: VOC family protein [Rhizomicrobium sp.]